MSVEHVKEGDSQKDSNDAVSWLDPELFEEQGVRVNIQTIIGHELFARSGSMLPPRELLKRARDIYEDVFDAEQTSLAYQVVGSLVEVFKSGVYPINGGDYYWNHVEKNGVRFVIPDTFSYIGVNPNQEHFIELFSKALDDLAEEIMRREKLRE